MSHNRDLSAAAAQLGFHSSNIGIGSEAPRYPLDIHSGNLLVSGSAAGNLILEDRGVGDSSRPFALLASNDGNFTISSANRNVSGTTTSSAERLRIDSNGKIGINNTSPTAPLSIKVGSGGEYVQDFSGSSTKQFGFFYDQNNWNAATFRIDEFDNNGTATSRLTITDGGKVGVGCDAEVDFQVRNGNGGILKVGGSGNSATGFQIQYNNSGNTTTEILTNYRATSGSASLKIDTGTFLVATGTSGTERLRITSDGKVGVGVAAPAQMMEITNTSGTGSQIQMRDTSTAQGNNNGLRVGYNGSGGQMWNFESTYLRFATSNAERLRILSNGHVNIGGYLSSVSNSGLHVGRSSGGTAAGESVLAATLGNDSTMVSALLTVKNAGNRGGQGASGGSPLAKFEFNNGTAFEIDKYGRRTLPYQPGCKLSIDTNSTGGGNHAQTGRTILPFNNTAFGYNTGNHFNTSNHTFTAPLDGKYLVILSVNVIGDNIAYIYKNGSIHSAGEFRSNPTGIWEHMEISTVVDCSANDTIQPYSQMTGSGGRKFNGGSGGSYWDTFTIYFLG